MVLLRKSLKKFWPILLLLGGVTGCWFDKTKMSTVHVVTDWGHGINDVYARTSWIMLFVFLGVAIPYCYALWRFREKEGDTHIPKQVHGNSVLEIIWTLIPVVLLVFIFIPTFKMIMKQYEEPAKDALVIEAIGHQWWWEFKYPEYGITTANEMYVPADRNITVKLKSADVIHSFWIPRWGGKVDNLPGVTNVINYKTPSLKNPNGDYYLGHCAELCGLSHARMRYEAVVVSKESFENWTKAYNQKPKVTTALEEQGQKLFMSKTCVTCHKIEGTMAMGMVGPNLTNFGNRRTLAAGTLPNTKAGLREWILDSVHSKAPYQKVKPGSLMVFPEGYEISDQEIKAISAYLLHSTAKTY